MSDEITAPPTLPTYKAPSPRPTATLPQGMEIHKPGIMSKMLGKALSTRRGIGRSSSRSGIKTNSTIKFKGKAFKAGKKKSQFE